MNRFLVKQSIDGTEVAICDRQQVHHLRNVLRLVIGDQVTIFSGDGSEYRTEIKNIERSKVTLRVLEQISHSSRNISLTVACAVPKASGMDDIIDGLTQLGADTIIPMLTERTIVKLDQKSRVARHERWLKIAVSASEQSKRIRLPKVTDILEFVDVISKAHSYDYKVIAALSEGSIPLREVVSKISKGSIIVLIGPEGDFTEEEVIRAQHSGFTLVSLGETTLRVATAAIAAASYIHLSRGPD